MSNNAEFHYDEQPASLFLPTSGPTYQMKTWQELLQKAGQIDFDGYLVQ